MDVRIIEGICGRRLLDALPNRTERDPRNTPANGDRQPCPASLGEPGPLSGPVEVLYGSAARFLVDQFREPHLLEQADVVADAADTCADFLRELVGTSRAPVKL